MHNQETMRLLFIINPVSGGKGKDEGEAAIREYFKNKPHTVDFFLLTGENDSVSIQHHITTIKPDRVIAVGGDGTIKLVAEVLKETPIPLGIIPAGSANGMAKELNIPVNITDALSIITDGISKKIDLIKINEEELCIHLSDIGMNAMIVKYYDELEGRGWMTYAKALLRVIWRKRKFRCTIKTDSGILKRKAYMIVIANASKYGMGGVINPQGDVGDTHFEVVIVKKLNIFAVLNGMTKQQEFDPEKIEVVQTKNLELNTQRKVHFQVDGEYLGKVANIKARILPQILNVMVPQKESA